jgi:exodeoxyribonuclease VII small subunit
MSKIKLNTFEQSLQKLDQTVKSMEEDSLPLEDLLKCYETGMILAKECEDSIAAAYKKLEVIRNKANSTQPKAQTDTKQDDEIRLF